MKNFFVSQDISTKSTHCLFSTVTAAIGTIGKKSTSNKFCNKSVGL